MHLKYNIVNENYTQDVCQSMLVREGSCIPILSCLPANPRPLFVRKKSAKKPLFVRNFFGPFGVVLLRNVFPGVRIGWFAECK